MHTKRSLTAALITALFCTLAPGAVAAEPPAMPMASYYSFSTDDPDAVVAALAAFSKSECRANMPVSMTLMGTMFNGNAPGTHTMILGAASAADMQAAFATYGDCAEAKLLTRAMGSATDPVAQTLGMPIVSEGDPEMGRVFTIWGVTVTDEQRYAGAYLELMEAQMEAGAVNGPYGVIRVVGGRVDGITHYIYTGSPSMAEHFSGNGSAEAYQGFNEAVGDIRTVVTMDTTFQLAQF